MDRCTRGKGRGGRGKVSAVAPELHVTNRSINWTHVETGKFLTATREVQVRCHRADVKFTPTEWNQVLQSFHGMGDFSHRCLEAIKNRMKVLRAEYGNVKDLLSRSGWGWDSATQMVMAPSLEDWDDLAKESKKLRSFQHKSFPWYEQFVEIIGNSATTGEFGQNSVVPEASGTDSSSGAREYDIPVIDSEERARFEFNQIPAPMEEDTVQQPLPAEPPSADTGGTNSARSRSSNKRKSSDTGEGSRSQRAKRSIQNMQQSQDNMLSEVRELVKTSGRLAVVGEEFVELTKRRFEIPSDVCEALRALVLKDDDRNIAMRALKDPIEQQIFMFGGHDHKVDYLNKLIPGFQQMNTETGGQSSQFNPFFSHGFYGGSAM